MQYADAGIHIRQSGEARLCASLGPAGSGSRADGSCKRIAMTKITPEMTAAGAKALSAALKPFRRQLTGQIYHLPLVDIAREVFEDMDAARALGQEPK